MNKVALLVRHRAKPGQRDRIQQVWSQYVQQRVAANDGHEQYWFCHDNNDPDALFAFQVFSSEKDMKAFLGGDWYPEYLENVSEAILEPPIISEATPVWSKG